MFFLREEAQINQLRRNVILTKRGPNKPAALDCSIYEKRPKQTSCAGMLYLREEAQINQLHWNGLFSRIG